MSFTQAPALSAIAFQLAARLEQYEEDMSQLQACPTDPGVYRRVSGHMDDMRMYAAALPVLSVAWVEVLIRHFELTHALFRQRTGADVLPLEQVVELHHQAVRRLASRCTQLMPRA